MDSLCPKCNSLLRIGKSYYSFEDDTTPELQTKAFINLDMICVNSECDHYAGTDLENPKWIIETIKNGVN